MTSALNQSFETDVGLVRYAVGGDGPDLIAVHGTPWSSYSYSRIIPELEKRYRVFCYDLPGYGASAMFEGQRVALDVQGEVLARLLDHWNIDAPYVMAHDFGGAISLRAHLLHGCDYARLLLMNVVALAPWGSPFFAHVQQHEAAFAGVPAYIHEAIVERYITGAMLDTPEADVMDQLKAPWLTPSGQAAFYRQIAQASQRYTDEIESEYARIRCPVRILWGADDEWIPLETGRRLNAAIAGSEFFEIEAAAHLVQLEQPDRVLDLAQEFFV